MAGIRTIKLLVLVTSIVFLGNAIYLYGFRFMDWIESDAAVPTLMAADLLRTGRAIATDWYNGNGDVVILGGHHFAVLPLLLLGIGPGTARIALLLVMVVQLLAIYWAYDQLARERRWTAAFAALVTLSLWSQFHLAFVYLQPAYGVHATIQAATFAGFATAFAPKEASPRRLLTPATIVAVVLLFLISAANPRRGIVFLLAPILVACVWPWRGIAAKERARVAGLATATSLLGVLVYTQVFLRISTFSPFASHDVFAFRDAAGIAKNIRTIVQGLFTLAGASVLGMAILLGACVFVGRHVFQSRAATPLRFFGVLVLVQMGGALLPLVAGNLVEAEHSIRYVMTSFLLLFGLAAVIAAEESAARWQRASIGWMGLVPIAAAIVGIGATSHPPTPKRDYWPDVPEQVRIVDELSKRKLTHGFADNWNANILTLLSRGEAKTCPVFFRNVLIPQRWNVERYCYDAESLPDRFFVLSYLDAAEELASATRATRQPPLETFSVGPSYLVSVFRTADAEKAWLALPIADGDRMQFPLHLPASHPAFRQHRATEQGTRVVATGEPGTVVYGPYVRLSPGRYRVRWLGSGASGGGAIYFDASTDGGTIVAAKHYSTDELAGAQTLVELDFALPRGGRDVELRVMSEGGAKVTLDEVVIERR